MTVGRAVRVAVALTIPVTLTLAVPAVPAFSEEGFAVAMGDPEEGNTEYPFKCMRGDYAFANGRVFVRGEGELFWAGLDDSFKGYSGRSEGDHEEIAEEFCRRVLQRKRVSS